jgi:phage-related protein (TIGR01555 family)
MIVDQYGKPIKRQNKKRTATFRDRFYNSYSGAGCASDKSQAGYYGYSYIAENKELLEYMYVGSWSAAKIIDIPVDDMFMFPRTITNQETDKLKQLEEIESTLNLNDKIKSAIKSARAYGTAFLVLITDERRMSKPLNLDSPLLNLKNILVVDRFDASVIQRTTDITDPNFSQPELYNFTFKYANELTVHYSRVIRIDAIKAHSVNSWYSLYNQDWAVSELVRVLSSVEQEESMSSAINYLLQEASVTNLKIPDLKDALAGAPDSDNIDTLVENINDFKSIYRTMYLDKDMELNRLEPNFDNFSDLFDKFYLRLSAAADIPQTRFYGRSPSGLNSSGDSEMQNYAIMIASKQQDILVPIYNKIDLIIEKMLGMSESIKYEFKPLLDISSETQADIEYKDAQRDQIYLSNNVITSEEVRDNLKKHSVYSDLSDKIENNNQSAINNQEIEDE